MAVELAGVVVGGLIGLCGALGGATLGHLFTSRRDTVARNIEGLRRLTVELSKRSRLALSFDQHINLAERRGEVGNAFAQKIFDVPGWIEGTHELQETPWRFDCLAYLPESLENFIELDHQIAHIMTPTDEGAVRVDSRKQAISELVRLSSVIHAQIQKRLQELL